LINSIGNLAGFAAPYAMGYLKDATGGFTAGLLAVRSSRSCRPFLVLILGHNPALERGNHPGGGSLDSKLRIYAAREGIYGDRGIRRPDLVRDWHSRPLIRTRRAMPGQPRKMPISASSSARGPRRACRGLDHRDRFDLDQKLGLG